MLCLALAAVALAVVAHRHSSALSAARSGNPSRAGLSSLPLAAQGPVSATLGANSRAYRVGAASGGGFTAANPAQRLSTSFDRSGVSVRSGSTRVGLRLGAMGNGAPLSAVGAVTPRVRANRVVYSRAGLEEWYANGPLGLEQGFTLAKAPSGHPGGALTLSMALSGNARAGLASGGQSVLLRGAGGPTLRYGGLRATDATGRVLHSWLQLHSGRLLILVDTSAARYPLRIDPLVQQAKLTGAEEIGGARFGFSVALSSDGNTALVGGQEDNSSLGAAWVFTRSGSTWTQQGPKLVAGSEEVGAGRFGHTVALSSDGNTALIGGHHDNAEVGAAWVFTRSGTTWTQQGPKLTGGEELPEGGGLGGGFGGSVALSSDGNTAVIGGDGDNAAMGAAWIFTRTGSTWTQQGPKLTGSGVRFGTGVAISSEGNTALVGADGTNKFVGAAFVFTRSGSTWTQQGPALTGGEEIGEVLFGLDVALSSDGNTALIGGSGDNTRVGAAWVFSRSGSTWAQQGPKLVPGSEEVGKASFGYAVALSSDGNTALVGGPDDNNAIGATWEFTRSGTTWTQQGGKLTANGEIGAGNFGISVALSSNATTALIGGSGDGRPTTESGAAWVFGPATATPTVTKVEPSSGPASGGTSVTITGTNFTGATAVNFGLGAATSFTVNSATSITAVSPAGMGMVDVTVTTPAGTSPASPADQFTYGPTVEPPTVTGIEPTTGPPSGGTSVTITGTNFTGATAVKFGANNATSFTVNSATSITAVSPAGTGLVDVTVTNPAGTSATGFADHFDYRPFVSTLVPGNGPNAGGTSVEIIGTNFNEVEAVKFGSTNVSFTRNSETSITAVSPPFPGGSARVRVSVTTRGGVSPERAATILGPEYFGYAPIVTGVSPKSGPAAGGTHVTIEGKAFESIRKSDEFPPFVKSVKFGSTNATSFEVHPTGGEASVTAVAPPGAGTVDVTVETYTGTSPTSSADRFSYVQQPTVTKVEPNTGPAIGGTSLTITGTNFTGATAVKFGSTSATSYTVNSETSITVFSLPGTGTVDVTVTTPSGTSAASEADRFTYGPPATTVERLYVTNLSGNTISLFDLGGEGQLLENGTLAFPKEFQSPDPVVIGRDGTSLYVGTEANNFNGTVSQFTVASDGTLTLKEPPWVSNESEARPEGLAISPDGMSLYAAATGGFGVPGPVAQYNIGSGGLLSFKEPHAVTAGAGPNGGLAIAPNGSSVYVSNFGENTISQYSVGAGGTLTPMTPATVSSGTEPDGIAVSPDGSSLYVADYAQGAISQYSVGPGGALSPKTPEMVPAGQEPTQVATSPDGQHVYASDRIEAGKIFQYTVGSGGALIPNSPAFVPAERQPTGLAISPDSKNLYVAETISNTVSQYRIEANGDLSLLATARTGTAPKGIAFASVSSGPSVTSVEPKTGPAAGGTSVTITGTKFTGATAVRFGSTNATSFTVNSETSITAVSPAGTGTVDVTVTTAAGTSPTRPTDQFTYGPTVSRVEPNRGSPNGGTTVTIMGTGLTGATAVKFGAASAKSFTVNSATSITAVTPKVKGTGTVDVTVTTPAGTSPASAADQFTFSRK